MTLRKAVGKRMRDTTGEEVEQAARAAVMKAGKAANGMTMPIGSDLSIGLSWANPERGPRAVTTMVDGMEDGNPVGEALANPRANLERDPRAANQARDPRAGNPARDPRAKMMTNIGMKHGNPVGEVAIPNRANLARDPN